MKARIKATGEIVEARRLCQSPQGPIWEAGGSDYYDYELDFDNLDYPDYWEKLKHQYAGMAMQGLLANGGWDECSWDVIAEDALRAATALVQKPKNG